MREFLSGYLGLHDWHGLALTSMGIVATVRGGRGLETGPGQLGCRLALASRRAARGSSDLALLRQDALQESVTVQGRGCRVGTLLPQRPQHGHGFWPASARCASFGQSPAALAPARTVEPEHLRRYRGIPLWGTAGSLPQECPDGFHPKA